jgi:glutathione peroxidase
MKRLLSGLAVAGMLVAPTSIIAQSGAQMGSAFDQSFVAIDGSPMPLAKFRGKVLLIVNTASFCGFTKQYDGLQKLHDTFGPQGLVVIGVPSNDFGSQEPKANAEIAEFCQGAFSITFPLTEKMVVKGKGAHPFYAWAGATLGEAATPRWNFHKYLVGRDGRLLASFTAQVAPDASTLVKAIETALGPVK